MGGEEGEFGFGEGARAHAPRWRGVSGHLSFAHRFADRIVENASRMPGDFLCINVVPPGNHGAAVEGSESYLELIKVRILARFRYDRVSQAVTGNSTARSSCRSSFSPTALPLGLQPLLFAPAVARACYRLPLARLWVMQSIWQFLAELSPPLLHAAMWSASISSNL